MERAGWLAFASATTLVAAALLANGFLLVQSVTDSLEARSRADPPRLEWYEPYAPYILYGGAGLIALGVWPMTLGWAKVRAKTVAMRRRPAAPEAVGDEEDPLMPPGFLGPAAKTRRVGAAPLIGFTFLGLLLLAAAGAILVLGTATLAQTINMEGRGLKTAVFWGQLVKFLGLPLIVLGTIALTTAWGRWFPLGEIEVIETKTQTQRLATGYSFNRQD